MLIELGASKAVQQGKMAKMTKSLAPVLIFTFFSCYASIIVPSLAFPDAFRRCLSANNVPSQLVLTPSSPSFTPVLESSIRNPKFNTPTTVRPSYIVTPTNVSHVQAAVVCGRANGVRLPVRSGGHDYEGLSFRSVRPEVFAVVDLSNLRSVHVDARNATAWVDSGATVGELYYAVANESSLLGFPAGLCPTIGIGGHFSGGGFGTLLRKYGTAIDNVVDAILVDAKGRILDRDAMGSDVFWAIRGGGGESFGIVLSWKVRLVPVPPTVTAFSVPVTVDQGAVDVLTKWQEVSPAFPEDLFLRVLIQNKAADFQALYLGTCDAVLPVMNTSFPELGMNRSHCKEMSWIESVPYFYLGNGSTVEDILNRTTPAGSGNKATSDYVLEPISNDVWAEIFTRWLARPDAGLMIMDPYGGAISAVPEDATPFPHRAGVLYNIQYYNFWSVPDGNGTAQTKWIRDLYAFMEPHVSADPRQAYFNYRDLDLGENVVVGNVSSYEAGKVWGEKYFKDNYQRLAVAKGQIDPDDYFRNEQSVPPLVRSQ